MEDLNNSKYHHIFHKSKQYKNSKLLLLFLSIIVGVLSYIFNHGFISFIFFSVIIILLILTISTFKNKEIVKMSNKGVFIDKYGFFNWKEINSFKIKNEYSLLYYLAGDNIVMTIYFNHKKPTSLKLDISGIENRKTLIALTNYYLDKQKNEKN